jgi:hypothetical protein
MNFSQSKGSVTLLVLVFGGIFLAVLMALAGYVLSINGAEDSIYQHAEASSIAEGGLQQYEWYLSQNPDDVSTPDPATAYYTDVNGNQIGTYMLGIAPSTACGQTIAYTLTATGTPNDAPSISTTISTLYTPALSEQDLLQLKSLAQTAELYFPQYASTTSPTAGYSIVFNDDGSISVTGIANDGSETILGTYPVSPDCALIYAEDNVLISGTPQIPVTIIGTTEEATTTGSTLTFISMTASSSSPFSSWQEN